MNEIENIQVKYTNETLGNRYVVVNDCVIAKKRAVEIIKVKGKKTRKRIPMDVVSVVDASNINIAHYQMCK